MQKDINILIRNDRKSISIDVKDISNNTVIPILLRELTASSFASSITSEICKMFNISDNDDKIYHNMYEFGRHILAMPDEYASTITIALKVDIDSIDEKIWCKIKDRRESLRLKREYIAARMDVSTSLVTKWEKGERKIPINRIVELCNILKISPNELLGWK